MGTLLDQMMALAYTILSDLPQMDDYYDRLSTADYGCGMVGHPYGCQQEGILLSHDSVSSEQSAHRGDDRALTTTQTARSIEIPQALPMRLHVLDIARHVVIAPNGKRYVVATYDDTRLGHGYVTAVYPQQNGYLTLIRLTVYETTSASPEEAVQHHIAVAQDIQQGKMNEFNK